MLPASFGYVAEPCGFMAPLHNRSSASYYHQRVHLQAASNNGRQIRKNKENCIKTMTHDLKSKNVEKRKG